MATRKSSSRAPAAHDLQALATLLRQAADAVEDLPSRSSTSLSAQLCELHESVVGILTLVEPSPPLTRQTGDQPEGATMHLDREANAALQDWGRWTTEEFQAQWKQLDRSLVKRTCRVTGLTVPRSWTRPQQAELHRRAQRFARNTAL